MRTLVLVLGRREVVRRHVQVCVRRRPSHHGAETSPVVVVVLPRIDQRLRGLPWNRRGRQDGREGGQIVAGGRLVGLDERSWEGRPWV